ncbi:25420_t:CDS:1, partial [Racocetra persica]
EAWEPLKKNWNGWKNSGSRGPCLCCGQNGHFARDCLNPFPRDNNRNIATEANATPSAKIPIDHPPTKRCPNNNDIQNAMQTLLNLVGANSQENESQAFPNLHDKDTLYNIGEERE